MPRLLISLGLSLVLIGVLWHFGGRLGFLGQLPGDIHIKRGNTTIVFPLMTCLVLSVGLSLIMWMIGKLRG